jgi:hypothetical protein
MPYNCREVSEPSLEMNVFENDSDSLSSGSEYEIGSKPSDSDDKIQDATFGNGGSLSQNKPRL